MTMPGNYTSPRISRNRIKITQKNMYLEADGIYRILLSSYQTVSFNSTEYLLATAFIANAVTKASTPVFNDLVYLQIEEFAEKMKFTNVIVIIIFCLAELFSLAILLICYFIKTRILDIYTVFGNLDDPEIAQKVRSMDVLLNYFSHLRTTSIFASIADTPPLTGTYGGWTRHTQPTSKQIGSKGVLYRSKTAGAKRSRWYFFGLKWILAVSFILLNAAYSLMIVSMVIFSERRQILNDILFNFRFVGKSVYLLTVLEHGMTDLILTRMGVLSFPTFADQAKRLTTFLASYDESNTICRKHFSKFPPEEAEYFFNYAYAGSSCDFVDRAAEVGLSKERCRTMANGIFSQPMVSHYDYFSTVMKDILTRLKASTDPEVGKAIMTEQSWLELQFLVSRMQIPIYKGYTEEFLQSLGNYQSIDSSRTWRTIYLIESLLYFVALSLFLYLFSRISSHTAVCFQSIKLLPSKAISYNAYVKVKLKTIERRII